jgi:prepilin-type N-terminal cleavage/methylation domain-containing protein
MKTVRHRGFTLLEMLVVLVLVGIFSGLLFPGFTAIRRTTLQHRSRWQFCEIISALETYALHYGHWPTFLQPEEKPLALAQFRRELVEALQGVDDGESSIHNADNVRFFVFPRSFFNSDGAFVDAFGNENLSIVVRKNGRLRIPQEVFPKSAREGMDAGGITESLAIWSCDERGNICAKSWQ